MGDGRITGSRVRRAASIAGAAAGVAARSATAKAVGGDSDARKAAAARQQLKSAEALVKVLGGMRGAAMKVGQTLSAVDLGPGPRGGPPRVPGDPRHPAAGRRAGQLQGDLQGRHRGGPRRPLSTHFRRLRRGADRGRVDRPGPPGDDARRPRRRGQGPVPGHRRGDPRRPPEPAPGAEAPRRDRARRRHGSDRRRDPRAHRRGARLRARGVQPARDGARLPRPPVRRRARTSSSSCAASG